MPRVSSFTSLVINLWYAHLLDKSVQSKRSIPFPSKGVWDIETQAIHKHLTTRMLSDQGNLCKEGVQIPLALQVQVSHMVEMLSELPFSRHIDVTYASLSGGLHHASHCIHHAVPPFQQDLWGQDRALLLSRD